VIDRLYTTLQVIATKDVRGNLSPEDFNLLLNNVIEEKYEEYFYDLNRHLNRQNRGLTNNGFASIGERISEKLRHYYQSKDVNSLNDVYTVPDTARFVDSIYHTNKEVEIVKSAKLFYLMNNSDHISPKASRPIALETGREYTLAPDTLTGAITFFYLRNPLKAKWTYEAITGLYNPDAQDHQDVDMHPSEEQDILRRLVSKAGVNLNDQELAKYGIVEQNKEFQENITP